MIPRCIPAPIALLVALPFFAAAPVAAGPAGSARMAIVERSVVLMTAAEIGHDRDAFVAFSTMPGTTVAQFTLSCKTGSGVLGEEAMRAFKATLAKSMHAALDKLSAARVGRNAGPLRPHPARAVRDARPARPGRQPRGGEADRRTEADPSWHQFVQGAERIPGLTQVFVGTRAQAKLLFLKLRRFARAEAGDGGDPRAGRYEPGSLVELLYGFGRNEAARVEF